MSQASDLGGIAAMLAATATFVVGDSFVKLVTDDLPAFEVLFLRGVAAGLACAVLLVLRGEWRALAGAFDRHALLRAAGETGSTLCYIVALSRMPIADAIAILQTAPLILVLGAAVLLRERIGALRFTLAVAGFIGALMVAQPGAGGLSPSAWLAFTAALLIAARDLVGRKMPARIPVTVIVFATTVMTMFVAGALSFATETWVAPTTLHLARLGAAGVFLTLGHAGLVLAYRLGRTAVIAPFFYSLALWAVVAGVAVWGALPNSLALAGIGLIAASGIAIVWLDFRGGAAARLQVDAEAGR